MTSLFKRTIDCLAVLLFVFFAIPAGAQQILSNVSLGDIIQLEAEPFRGEIQWQKSTDNESWSDISDGKTGDLSVSVDELPIFFRAQLAEDGCQAQYSETIILPVTMNWSDPETWNGEKPRDGDVVVVPVSQRIILDENTPSLGGLTIKGTLEFDRKNLELTSKWIVIDGGTLRAGTEGEPFEQKAIITLNDTNTEASVMGMGTRGIMVMSGALELHGATPELTWVKLVDHSDAGSHVLHVSQTTDWKAGDEIVIAPTDYYEAADGNSITQQAIIVSIDYTTNQITIDRPLNAHRWGKLQIATENGMALANSEVSPVILDDDDTTPNILDERAEVGNLTRNIVIQAPSDNAWENQGFGVHTMIMPKGTAHIEGVEFKHAGQRGRERRYPFHWHMLSYSGTETLGDASGQYFNKNSIFSSAHRGVVIHGTNGVTVRDNVVFDIRGHGIFTEDAVERRNLIDHNLVLHVRNPFNGTELKQHETGTFGSSGFWISNPDNTVINNVAADCGTFGFWLAFPEQPWGLSQSVLHTDGLQLRPNRLLFGTFDNNTTHSNRMMGIMFDNVEIDNEGNTEGRRYRSTTHGRETTYPNTEQRRFTLSRYKTWKNGDNGIWDRSDWVNNIGAVSADNCGRFFAGAGQLGVIEHSLVVGTSLNHLMNGTNRPGAADFHAGRATSDPCAFATYHSTFDIKNNIVVDFPAVADAGSGAFSTDDYYLLPLDKGQARNTNNRLIRSHPGVKLLSVADHFTLSSALWDPYGIWGSPGNYFVYDDPFIVTGKETTEVAGGSIAGGVSVAGPFYGFEGFVLHGLGYEAPRSQPWADFMRIYVRRLDASLNEVATWDVAAAEPDELLPHMRDFITTPDAIYELTFPDETKHPTDFQMNVYNMLETHDLQVMSIQFDGDLEASVYMGNQQYTSVATSSEVIDSEGETYWQDYTNNRVWVKMRGGTRNIPATTDPNSDAALYEMTPLRIVGNPSME